MRLTYKSFPKWWLRRRAYHARELIRSALTRLYIGEAYEYADRWRRYRFRAIRFIFGLRCAWAILTVRRPR